MTTAVASPFFDFNEVMNKNNKMLNYNNNNILSAPHHHHHHPMSIPCTGTTSVPLSPPAVGPLLDRKAVGTPSAGGGVYQRRHSVTLPGGSKFNQNQFLNSLKADPGSLTSCGLGGNSVAASNKENRMRDRSFSETGERLMQKCLGGGVGVGGGGGGPVSPTGSSSGGQVNSSRYKTELCRPFEENGACKYGDKCQFAHGAHELRSLSRHPKYKTELCRTFHTIGFCPYGPRCHFIHNADERRGPPPSSSCGGGGPLLSPLSPSNKMERPRLQHSYSFAGFSSSGGGGGGGGGHRRDSPTSVTPPPIFSPDELPDWPSSNPFTYSSQELANLFGPSLGGSGVGGGGVGPPGCGADPAPSSHAPPPSPPGTPYFFRPMSPPQRGYEGPASPPDSLSDQDGYQSSSGGSLSGSESPGLDTNRRLPIFSRLSISDD